MFHFPHLTLDGVSYNFYHFFTRIFSITIRSHAIFRTTKSIIAVLCLKIADSAVSAFIFVSFSYNYCRKVSCQIECLINGFCASHRIFECLSTFCIFRNRLTVMFNISMHVPQQERDWVVSLPCRVHERISMCKFGILFMFFI